MYISTAVFILSWVDFNLLIWLYVSKSRTSFSPGNLFKSELRLNILIILKKYASQVGVLKLSVLRLSSKIEL